MPSWDADFSASADIPRGLPGSAESFHKRPHPMQVSQTQKSRQRGQLFGTNGFGSEPDFQLQSLKPVNRFKNLAIAFDEPA
ncbi:MAG: hypothetical protein CMQ69_07145 [Gammaproteobacteria bacterium]|nr:hypothetical protein [Gammaproteobacteria bacterium]